MPLSNIGDTLISIILFFGFLTSIFDLFRSIPIQDLWALSLLVKITTEPDLSPSTASELGDGFIWATHPHQWPPRILLW